MASPTVVVEGGLTESFMLPGMASPEPDASGRLVRFDKECVLIPEIISRSKLPLMVTKSVALPLWRRKGYPTSDSDVEDPSGSSPLPLSPHEDSRVVIKVPIPLFRRRSSRSPTRGRSVSSSPVMSKTLSSCLAHRAPTASPPNFPLTPVRRSSLSYSIYHRRKEDVTIPLRACCEACERVMEESLKEGEKWEEKFTRGARRRRSASLDNKDINSLFRLPTSHARSTSFPTEFSALSISLDDMAESGRYEHTPAFALTVDEEDKRRKSFDSTKDALEPFLAASPPSPAESTSAYPFPSPRALYAGNSRYARSSRPYDREVSSISTSSSTSDELLSPDTLDPHHRLRSSPIEEEDEAQLFPLPSPRRSPASTPSPCNSPRVSPLPSPSGSTSCLPASSKENVYKNPSQESLLKASLSRKLPAAYLAAPLLSTPRKVSPNSTRSSSPLTSPVDTTHPPITVMTTSSKRVTLHGLKIPPAPTPEERANSNPLSPKGPRPPLVRKGSTPTPPSSEGHTDSTTPSLSALTPLVPVRLTLASATSVTTTSAIPSNSTSSRFLHIGHTSTSAEPIDIGSSGPQVSLHARSSSAGTYMSSSPPSAGQSPISLYETSPRKPKHSFTLPFIRAGEALREVSVDVLRGVSSISGGGGVVGSV